LKKHSRLFQIGQLLRSSS